MRINIDLGERSYPVIIESGLLANAKEALGPYIQGTQVCIVTNDTVAPLYLGALEDQLKNDYQLSRVILPDGESHKNLATLNQIFETLLSEGCNRDVTLIALGGGVVGDMTGFAAASFMRGVHFIQIPTTLLAQVDSSVGGKTGVNHPLGKNMIGAFYQPQAVLIDVSVLKTLPARELSAGLAEVIKYGFIAELGFVDWLELNMKQLRALDDEALIYAVAASCECKAKIVSQDEREKGLRAILNLGHTFGHALESHYRYQHYLHGEAVAIGMSMALELSAALGSITELEVKRCNQLLSNAGLKTSTSETIDVDALVDFMKVDKKAQSGKIRLVLLKSLGEAYICEDFSLDKMHKAMRQCMPDNNKI